MVLIREKEIEEYIPKGKKTTITIEDYNAGYAAIFDVYGFKIVGKSKNHLCLLDDNMKTVFIIFNISKAVSQGEDIHCLYGKHGKFATLRTDRI